MAADVGDKQEGVNSINITPLVDVCLVLVLIFMVTMPLSILRGIDVKRQTLKKYGLSTPQENIQVHLKQDKVIVRNARGKKTPIPYEDAGAVVGQMVAESSRKKVFLRVDRNVVHGRTVWMMDLAKQNGALNISIME